MWTKVLIAAWLRTLFEARGTIWLLRLVSLFTVLWYERLCFLKASLQCSPWGASSNGALPPHKISRMTFTVLADPQLIDRYSYDYIERIPFPFSNAVYTLVRWAADTFARKSFSAVVKSQGRAASDAVIWIGDLLDNGRRALLSSDDVEEYEKYAHRFTSLFPEKLPSLYLPGNHDIRIPITHNSLFEQESKDSKVRWMEEWATVSDSQGRYTWRSDKGKSHYLLRPKGGPSTVKITALPESTNRSVNARFPLYFNESSDLPTHEIVLVDALELAGMFPASVDQNVLFDWRKEAKERFSETYQFVESLASKDIDNSPNRILFSHIPLYRPPTTPCNAPSFRHSVHRESNTGIEQGVDQYATYQNMLAQPVTEWLLAHSTPSIIFSGDNHDHCEISHMLLSGKQEHEPAHELTVKAFGMTGGVERPGFARLGLAWDPESNQIQATSIPCLLPNQVAIWTQKYPTILLLMLILMLADRRWRFGSTFDRIFRDQIMRWRLRLMTSSKNWHGEFDEEADEEWQLIEQGQRSNGRSSEEAMSQWTNENDEQDEILSNPSHLPSFETSPSSSKRIRYGRLGGAFSQPQTNVSSRTNFEVRAFRELKLAATTSEKVLVNLGPLAEYYRINSWAVLLWLWLQVF